ncbi:MAG: DUF637 domain-containing protein [Alphaproteobacteria bacterium]|jgi:filamentous hemagglutinin family protein|nr:DUF637 domain-containing protein [Alphaproteobacteria bacterium]
MKYVVSNNSVHKVFTLKGCVTRIVILSQISSHIAGAMEEALTDNPVKVSSSSTLAYGFSAFPTNKYIETQQQALNYFGSLDLTPKDILIFPAPIAQALIVNRIESGQPSNIAGSIKSDELSSMMFKNPKGFVINNPLISNVLDLDFVAQADEYFDNYSKERGAIEIKSTSLSSGERLENLRLKAESICIQESVLDPLNSLSIELLKGDKDRLLSNADKKQALYINPNTILRAAKLSIHSHNQLPLIIEGVLQSTGGNIEIFSDGDIVLHNVSCSGKLIIHTNGRVIFENDAAVIGGVEIHALSFENKGRLITKGNMDFGKTQIINKGLLQTETDISSETLHNSKSGHIIARTLDNLMSILPHNEGTIEFLDACTLNGEHSLDLKGTLVVNGLLDCQLSGVDSTLTLREGSQVKALKGATVKLHTLTNHGKLNITGENLGLYLTCLNNFGDIESVNGTYGEVFKLVNSATIRTLGHSTLNCTTVENKESGRFYTAGVHHVNVTGSYLDSGYVYSPTLFLLQGAYLQFLPHHQSFIANGVIKATQKLTVASEAILNMRHRLQFYSDNTIVHQGVNNQLQEYHKSDEDALYDTYYLLNPDFIAPRWERNVFKAYVNTFLTGHWGDYLRNLLKEPYGIVTMARGDLTRRGNDNIQAGGSRYTTFGQFKGSKSYIKTGYFPDNHAQIQADSGNFSNVTLNALGGKVAVKLDKDMEAKKFHAQAKTIAELNVRGSMSLKDASIAARLVSLEAQKDMQMNTVTLQAQDHIHASTPGKFQASDLQLKGGATTHIEGDQGIHIQGLQNQNKTRLKSSKQVILDKEAKGGELSIETTENFTNNASVEVDKFSQSSLHFQNNKKVVAKGTLKSKSQTYGDTEEAMLEGSEVVLDAPLTRGGFKGIVKADMAEILLKDMQLQELLRHIDIQNTLTYTVDDHLVVDEDIIIKCKMVLHAVGLENKSRITADKNFLSFIKRNILNGGLFLGQGSAYFEAGGAFTNTAQLKAKEGLGVKAAQILNKGDEKLPAVMEGQDISLESTQGSIESQYGQFRAKQSFQARSARDTTLDASEVDAGQSINITSARDTLIQSVVKRLKSGEGNYKDIAVRSLLNSGGSIALLSGNNTTLIGARLKAALDIGVAAQNVYSLALGLEEQETHAITDGSQTKYKLTNDVSQIQAGGNVGIHAKGMNYHQATDIVAQNLSLLGQDVVIDDVTDKFYLSETTKHEGGLFGQNTEQQMQRQESTSRGANFNVFERIGVKALNSISVKNIKCQAQETILDSPEVKILLGRNEMQSASTEKSSNVLWVRTTQSSDEKLDHQASEFKGAVKINAKNAMIERVAGQTLGFMKTLSGDIQNLSESEVVDYYNRKSKTVEGPSQAFAMVIALAVSMTGVGSALGAALVGTTLSTTLAGTMVSAAVTTLCSQAAVQLIAAKGNIIQAAEAMANTKVLESMALSAITAGITSQLCDVLHLQLDPIKKNLFDNIKQKGVENVVNLGANIVQGGDADIALRNAAVSTVVGALSASAAYEIGNGYSHNHVDPVTHKLLHAALGAASGALQGDDPAKGALTGAISATVAVTVTDIIQKDSKSVAKRALDRAERENIETTPENMRALIRQEIQMTGAGGKITSAITAMLLKQDMNIAIGASTNAIENNCLESMAALALHEANVMAEARQSEGTGKTTLFEKDREDTEWSGEIPSKAHVGIEGEKSYVAHYIAGKKAQYEHDGKSWGEKEIAQARKEAETELKGIEQVTWHEDVLLGGANIARKAGAHGLKAAGTYTAEKIREFAKGKVQEKVQEILVGESCLDAGQFVEREAHNLGASDKMAKGLGAATEQGCELFVSNAISKAASGARSSSSDIPHIEAISSDHDQVAHKGYYGRKADRAEKHKWDKAVNEAQPAVYSKHQKATTREEAERLARPGKPSQYFPGQNVEDLEREALKRGAKLPDLKDKGSTYVEYAFPYEIGVANGKPTKSIRVEMTNSSVPEFHGHPRPEKK